LRTKNLIPVEGHSHLARDPTTGAIVNINKTEIHQAQERKKVRKNQQKELQHLKQTVDHLADEMNELKRLILKLVEK